MLIAIDRVVVDEQTQPRRGLSDSVIRNMIDDLRAGDVLPEIIVYQDGDKYWLADGWHRMTAYKLEGKSVIEAKVYTGSARDAFLTALASNRAVPLTLDERKQAARRMLMDEEWTKMSDREIGRRCGIDGKTVTSMRNDLSAEIPQIAEVTDTTVDPTGQSGQKAQNSGVGDEPKGAKSDRVRALLAEHPTAPLDVIAKKAGVSRSLVSDVRLAMSKSKKTVEVSRNGKTYEMDTSGISAGIASRRSKPKHLSTKAWSIMKDSEPAKDPKTKRQLASHNRSLQVAIAKRLRDGESRTVKEAIDQIMRGAPVTLWERAYAAICELDPDDRVRLCRIVISECERPLSVVK
jgi:ParB-like chromosome segregation protein Spo0J